MPRATDLSPYSAWNKSGKKAALQLAFEQMDEILASHQPPPLSADQAQDVERIMADARCYYRAQGLIDAQEWEGYV